MITKEDIEFSKLSYTNKDFASLYPDLLDLAKQLTDKWDPSSSNESDPGVVLLKEGAFIADHNNYNIDKNVLECFLPSATQETSVRNLVEMNGYVPRYYVSSVGHLKFEYRIPDDVEANLPTTLEIKPFTLKVANEDGSVVYTQGPQTLRINATGIDGKVAVGENFDEVDFIEGTLSTLTVNGVENITLDNIDDNNRVYFPVKYVAENGIFISNTLRDGQQNYDFWKRENYLLTKPLGEKIFKLDYDSRMGLPYIEFPSDIANIIESGLTVRYIVSSGINGNIQAGKISKIISPANLLDTSSGEEVKIPTEYISVSNTSSMLTGKNPETIDEMYQSFKKIVHTFETLVTCKDFTDAIYMMSDDNLKRFVGNDIVTDIKTDYNNSIRVISYDEYGSFIKNVALTNGLGRLKFQATMPEEPEIGDIIIQNGKLMWYTQDKHNKDTQGPHWEELDQISYDDFVRASEAITPFDICVYTLKAFSMADYLWFRPWEAHSKSFEPPVGTEATNLYTHQIKPGLEDLKCINHQFKTPESGDIICFKNYAPLYITVIPYSKVTTQERDSIYDNIYRALSENFHSGMLDFGEELNTDTVYNVIVNCDDRIKSVRLDFEYVPKVLVMGHLENDQSEESKSANFTEYNLINDPRVGNYLFVDLIAKNVLAGRLALFDVDDNFDRQYGEVNVTEYDDVYVIESEVVIPSSKFSQLEINPAEYDSAGHMVMSADIRPTFYELNQNEYVQVAWPNYYTDITYPQYVYYRFESPDPDTSISENTEYELKAGEKITLVWTQNNATSKKSYGESEVIKPSFNLKPTLDTAYYRKTGTDGIEYPFDILSANQQIEHKVRLETILNDKGIPVYWITANNRPLFKDSDTEMLNSGEYFLYSNKQRDAMVVFGAGTLLHLMNWTPEAAEEWSGISEVTIDTIEDEGYNSGMSWRQKDFNGNPLVIWEMNLLTLTQGDAIHIDVDASESLDQLDNTWKEFSGIITYKVNVGTSTEDENVLNSNLPFRIRSRLDMTSDKYHKQELLRDQKITLWLRNDPDHPIVIENPADTSGEAITEADRLYYQVNTPVDILGDTTQSMKDLETYLGNYKLDIRTFNMVEPKIVDNTNPDNEGTITSDSGNLYITMDYKDASVLVPFNYMVEFNTLDTNRKEYIFPLYIDASKINADDFVEINAEVTGDITATGGEVTDVKLTHYGRDDLDIYDGNKLRLTTEGLHLLKLVVEGSWDTGSETEQESTDVKLSGDLTLVLTWSTPVAVAEYLTLMQFKIVGGLNKNINPELATLDDVIGRIEELMANSNDSSSIPYITYTPENSLAIQNEDLSDPTTLWDVNNVANPFTIAQIDLYTMYNEMDSKNEKRVGTIDIIKSMKAYTE